MNNKGADQTADNLYSNNIFLLTLPTQLLSLSVSLSVSLFFSLSLSLSLSLSHTHKRTHSHAHADSSGYLLKAENDDSNVQRLHEQVMVKH